MLWGMTAAQMNDDEFVVMAERQFKHVYKERATKWQRPDDCPALQSFPDVIGALSPVVRCCYSDESRKPPSEKVRTARRITFQETKLNTPGSELAKSTLLYDALKAAMGRSRLHSIRGIADQTALASYEAANELFETTYAVAFGDRGAWSVVASDSSEALRARKGELQSPSTTTPSS